MTKTSLHKKVLILGGSAYEGYQGDPAVNAFAQTTDQLLQDIFRVENVEQLDSVVRYRKETHFSPFNLEEKQNVCLGGAIHFLYGEAIEAGYEPVSAPIEGFFKVSGSNRNFEVNAHWYAALETIDVIAVSTTHIIQLTSLMKILKALEHLNKIVIIGGALVRGFKKERLQAFPFDFCLTSEAEKNLSAILNQVLTKDETQLHKIPGLYWRNNGLFHTSTAPLSVIDINSWRCYPTREFVKERNGMFQYESVRGCPYRCAFCNYPFLSANAKFRMKTAETIFEEWTVLESLGVHHIELVDSLFTIPQKRIRQFCHLLIESGLSKKLTWFCNARAPELGDLDFVRLLKEAGCRYIFIGVESGSQTILDNMNKRVTIQQNAQAIVNCNRVGIYSSLGIIVGFPGETDDTVKNTIDFLKQQSGSSVHVFLWMPDFNPATLVPIMQPEQLEKYAIEGADELVQYQTSVWGKQIAFAVGKQWEHRTMNQEEALQHACTISDHIIKNDIDAQDYSFSPYRSLMKHPNKVSSVLDYHHHVNFDAGWKYIYKMYLENQSHAKIREYVPKWLESSGFSYNLKRV